MYKTYNRYIKVESHFDYDGLPVMGFIVQTHKEHLEWLDSLDKVNFPIDLFIGRGKSVYLSTKESYLDKMTIEEITRSEYNCLKRVFGNTFNWKKVERTR